MTAFLSYSGGAGFHRRGRGRGRFSGRGRGFSGRFSYVAAGRHHQQHHQEQSSHSRNSNSHPWVRPKTKNDDNIGNDQTKEKKEEESSKGGVAESSALQAEMQLSITAAPAPAAISTTGAKHVIMTKHGRNQLILSRNPPSSVPSTSAKAGVPNETQPKEAGQTLMRQGKHRLVAVKPATTAPAPTTKTIEKRPFPQKRPHYKAFHHGPSPYYGLASNFATRRGVERHHPGKAKRIKLMVAQSKTEDEDVGIDKRKTPDNNAKTNDASKVNDDIVHKRSNEHQDGTNEEEQKSKKLTDFAYRETSRVRQHTAMVSHKKWSKDCVSSSNAATTSGTGGTTATTASARKIRTHKNMGLVRVQPNEKKTPICPTFLRGLQCQDPYCCKRHDVPKEYAMPVCSFFQRHGQCLRGDQCVFRHVKVNPRAMVCPSFSLLGFCEDQDCTMQHVRSGMGGGSGSSRMKINKSSK